MSPLLFPYMRAVICLRYTTSMHTHFESLIFSNISRMHVGPLSHCTPCCSFACILIINVGTCTQHQDTQLGTNLSNSILGVLERIFPSSTGPCRLGNLGCSRLEKILQCTSQSRRHGAVGTKGTARDDNAPEMTDTPGRKCNGQQMTTIGIETVATRCTGNQPYSKAELAGHPHIKSLPTHLPASVFKHLTHAQIPRRSDNGDCRSYSPLLFITNSSLSRSSLSSTSISLRAHEHPLS